MSEPKSAHEVILASIQAEDDGVTVNWKQTLLQYHEAATIEIKRLSEELERTQEAAANLGLLSEVTGPT
jgi:hypothetical protein